MKFSTSTDFTSFSRAGAVRRAAGADSDPPADSAELPHDERHLRRRALTLGSGERVLVDLAETVQLADGDRLVLDDGREVEIVAAPEELLEIVPRDAVHLTELAWHIGNRHLPAEIRADRILIGRDHVLKAMLEGLGATVTEIVAPFHPLRGAYGGHGHSHGHGGQAHSHGDGGQGHSPGRGVHHHHD